MTGTAATWPHRPSPDVDEAGRPFCVLDAEPWPCPSQQWVDGLAAMKGLPPATCYRTHNQPDEHLGVVGAVWVADVRRATLREPSRG